MKNMKKLLSLALVLALAMTSVITGYASESGTVIFNEALSDLNTLNLLDFDQDPDGDELYNNGQRWGKSGPWAHEAILANNGWLEVYAPQQNDRPSTSGRIRNITKKVKPLTNGETREITFSVDATNRFNVEASYGYINLYNSDTGAYMSLFHMYREPNSPYKFSVSTLGSYNSSDAAVSGYGEAQYIYEPNTEFANGNAKDTVVSDIKITFTPNSDGTTYTATAVGVCPTGTTSGTFTLTNANIPASDLAGYDTVEIRTKNTKTYSSKLLFKVKNIKIIENAEVEEVKPVIEFGSKLLLGTSQKTDVFTEALTDLNTQSLLDFDQDPDGDELYNNGQRWGKSGPWAHEAILANNGWLEVYAPQQNVNPGTSGRIRNITKKVKPLTNGETREISFTVGTPDAVFNGGSDGYVNLYNSQTGAYFTLFRIHKDGTSLEYSVTTLGSYDSSDAAVSGYGEAKYIYGPNTNYLNGQDVNKVNSDIKITFTPNGDGETYTATAVGVCPTGTTSGTFTLTNANIPASDLAGYDTVEIRAKQANPWSAKCLFKVKNLKITDGSEKDSLEVGANTVYLPCTNLLGTSVDYALIAAVCDKTTDAQKKVYGVNTYKANTTISQNLEVTVNITDPDTEYIKVFVFDNFENLTPYIKPLTTK